MQDVDDNANDAADGARVAARGSCDEFGGQRSRSCRARDEEPPLDDQLCGTEDALVLFGGQGELSCLCSGASSLGLIRPVARRSEPARDDAAGAPRVVLVPRSAEYC